MKKKYLFFDIDGTLLSHTNHRDCISESTLDALKKLKEEGHYISLATGRAYYLAQDISIQLGIHNLVYEGGNGVVVDGNNIHYELPDQEMIKKVIRKFNEHYLNWGVSNEEKIKVVTPSKEFAVMLDSLPFTRDVIYNAEYDFENEVNTRRIFVENKIDVLNKIDEIEDVGLMIYPGSPYALVEPDDKFKGILKMMDYIQGDLNEVVVFGDGMNDIKMFKQAAVSVAMGNGEIELKEIATLVTDDVDHDGIYNACVQLGLID